MLNSDTALTTIEALSFTKFKEQANIIENTNTCKISPLAKAPTTVVGTKFIKNDMPPAWLIVWALSVYALIAVVS